MTNKKFGIVEKRLDIEVIEDWRSWIDKIPSIDFSVLPEGYSVRILPPFAGAMIRFLIEGPDKRVSVYLDVFERLGYWYGDPYWEIYPDADGDTSRFYMEDVEGLMKGILDTLAKR